jgi:hypothetical protein
VRCCGSRNAFFSGEQAMDGLDTLKAKYLAGVSAAADEA